jgi:imidazolonepropionase-like amidohydrolase
MHISLFRKLITLFYIGFPYLLAAQTTFPSNGAPDHRKGRYLFTNAHIIHRFDANPVKGYLLIENGKVISTGAGEIKDSAAVVVDVQGGYIYPGFIDLYSTYGIEQNKPAGMSEKPQLLTKREGAYAWNDALKTDFRAHEAFKPDKKAAGEYLAQGFTTVLTRRADGISRGSSVLVSLSDNPAHEVILKKVAAHEMSFNKGSSTQNYPGSLMGCIALIRQAWYDARWYAGSKPAEVNLSLEKWNELENLPVFFESGNWQNHLRAQKICAEFGASIIVKGSGDEYRRADALKTANIPVVLPLNFPKPFDVEDAFIAENISLTDLKHWELAPANPAILTAKGVSIAFTLEGLKDKKDWRSMLLKAINHGLSEKDALKALTFTPAQLLGMDKQLGSLQTGFVANIVVMDKPFSDPSAAIYQTWAQGKLSFFQPFPSFISEGFYTLKVDNDSFKVRVKQEADERQLGIAYTDSTGEQYLKASSSLKDGLISIEWQKENGYFRLSGWKSGNDQYEGKGRDPKGNWVNWSMARYENLPATEDKKPENAKKQAEYGPVIYPFTAYGMESLPMAETVLFKNATVWTNEADGIMKETDVLISNGKITGIGKNLSAPAGAIIVDASGKHLTSGIIDEHSHIAISGGVNEAGKTSSAEVRIGDVIRDDDINLYRQLAGGVVAAQLLHGSANSIGGQSALVKFRWGKTPEEMKIEGADGFIKFALGENVKQSNWGDQQTVRFPQTRMGVEQVYVDHFTRAKAYAANPGGRRDLELECLAEILNKKRFITCHSYVQSEINMLMKVAERFNFRINTFTHILEGYKVADIMKKHGCGASSFADWWAYKFEVAEAIPYNAALLNEVGVVTAINSDDAEMARRLNQEAAKAVRYGGVSEEEAWKMVTLNPAKLLHLDNRTGSIKVGKDADLVLWTDNPLSIYARVIQTYVDGVKYYDVERDALLRRMITEEKARIINKMLAEKRKENITQPVVFRKDKEYHCEDIEQYFGE